MSKLEFQILMIEIELEFFAYVDSLPREEIRYSDFFEIRLGAQDYKFIDLPPTA